MIFNHNELLREIGFRQLSLQFLLVNEKLQISPVVIGGVKTALCHNSLFVCDCSSEHITVFFKNVDEKTNDFQISECTTMFTPPGGSTIKAHQTVKRTTASLTRNLTLHRKIKRMNVVWVSSTLWCKTDYCYSFIY